MAISYKGRKDKFAKEITESKDYTKTKLKQLIDELGGTYKVKEKRDVLIKIYVNLYYKKEHKSNTDSKEVKTEPTRKRISPNAKIQEELDTLKETVKDLEKEKQENLLEKTYFEREYNNLRNKNKEIDDPKLGKQIVQRQYQGSLIIQIDHVKNSSIVRATLANSDGAVIKTWNDTTALRLYLKELDLIKKETVK